MRPACPRNPTSSRSTSTGTTSICGRRCAAARASLIIEYNGSLSPTPDVRVAQPYSTRPWDGTDRFGASLGALEAVSARKGYVLVYSELAGVNAFFVRRELADGLPAGDAVRRRASNIFLSGHAHRRSRQPGGFVTID